MKHGFSNTAGAKAFIIILFFFFPNITHEEKVVLITGFEPFGKWEVNPSELVAENLNGSKIGNAKVIGIVLPVDYNESFKKLEKAIAKYKPDLIICLGLDGSARAINVEVVALNLKRDGWKFERINEKLFYTSTLPCKEIVNELRKEEIKARLSFFAGFYLCNFIFYNTMKYIEENGLDIKAGFIHIPPLKSQASYGMDLEEIIKAIKIAVEVSLDSHSFNGKIVFFDDSPKSIVTIAT